MAGSPYASSLGRLKTHTAEFLTPEAYAPLANAVDLAEVTKLLEPTAYGSAIALSASSYRGASLLEIAINRTYVQRTRLAIDSSPFAGRKTIELYLRRWDLQNIALILSAKVHDRPITETEVYLVSSRDAPAGFFAGSIALDDFRLLLQQPNLEAVVSQLTKFGYGGLLLPLLDGYQRTRDIFPLILALERDYYARLLESSRFFQGDEWTIREFVRSEIDVRNVMLVLKARDAGVSNEEVESRFVDGGQFARSALGELASARSVSEVVAQLSDRYPALSSANESYEQTRSLIGYESALQRERALRELKRLRSYPLSIAMTITYLYLAELERTDLRRIVYGKLYGLSPGAIQDQLVVARL